VFTDLSRELLSRLLHSAAVCLRSELGGIGYETIEARYVPADLAELQDDPLRRRIEVDVAIAMAALDVLSIVVLDREAGTAGLTDPGRAGEDYDPANFDLAAANVAAASVRGTRPSDASARLEPRPPPVPYVSGQPAAAGPRRGEPKPRSTRSPREHLTLVWRS
jgi:hypothetical protein